MFLTPKKKCNNRSKNSTVSPRKWQVEQERVATVCPCVILTVGLNASAVRETRGWRRNVCITPPPKKIGGRSVGEGGDTQHLSQNTSISNFD